MVYKKPIRWYGVKKRTVSACSAERFLLSPRQSLGIRFLAKQRILDSLLCGNDDYTRQWFIVQEVISDRIVRSDRSDFFEMPAMGLTGTEGMEFIQHPEVD